MKAIILAAGIGSRLKPITEQKPKTMVLVNNKPILSYLIEGLIKNNIKKIVICVGYKSNQIISFCRDNYKDIEFNFVENKDFTNTNNMYSLYLAKDYLNEDVLLMNADLIYDSEIIGEMISSKKTCVAVDKDKYIEESMKIAVEGEIISSISKKILEKDAYGCSIDVYKINKEDLNVLKSEMLKIIEIEKDVNQWTELLLNRLFEEKKMIAYPLDINDKKWIEIDNFGDLAEAEILFNENLNILNNKKIFFVDGDGTLYLENTPIEGTIDFILKLKEKNKLYYLLTNNSSKTPSQYKEKINSMGINIEEENILISIMPTLDFFKEKGIKKIYCVANKEVSEYVKLSGFFLTENNPEAILLTYDTEIDYNKLCTLIGLIRKNIPYYTTHSDIVCPTSKGDMPDIGSFIELIKTATGISPIQTFGKPDINFIESSLRKNNLSFSDAVIIGDRLYTDIKLKNNTDMTSILVLSGETKRDIYETSSQKADIVVPSIKDLVGFI
jgi:HAD superfamily hydrolase (TIGR01450 family)